MAPAKNLFPKAKSDVALAPYTTFGLGGRAEYLLDTTDPEEVVAAIKTARKNKIPYRLIGGGSNVVCDNRLKVKGLVIVYYDQHCSGTMEVRAKTITGACCLPLNKLVERSIAEGLAGLEALTAIPGTVGGAIVGNAGAYGHSISEILDSVLVFDGKKDWWMNRAECRFGYRSSLFKKKKNLILLSAQFKFKKGDKKDLQKISTRIAADRLVKYGHIKSPGSFFKNVLVSEVSKKSLALVDQTKIIDGKIPTGYLLAAVGAKGMTLGGLKIADYHGNLIINRSRATFCDVQKLVKILKDRVRQKFGIKLEEEVRYLI